MNPRFPKLKIICLLAFLGLFTLCNSQNNRSVTMNTPDTLVHRKPAVADRFYPGDSAALRAMLKELFSHIPAPGKGKPVIAVISPHAGYVFSGEVAAAAIGQADPEKEYKNVFILGCSHRASYQGASIYAAGNYITPLGMVNVNLELARKLIAENRALACDSYAQLNEHSLEVQVPFLQYHLEKEFRIVPILFGTQDPAICKSIASTLNPYLTPENLFVISTDFSHYPPYQEAVKVDQSVAEAIVTNNPVTFLKTVRNCERKGIENLSTGCCSWPGVLTLIYMTENMPGISYREVLYRNSGDSKYGDRQQVVGYYALSVSGATQDNSFAFSGAEKKELLAIARNTIREYLSSGKVLRIDTGALSPALLQKAGAFVTLRKNGDLRGCIGHFDADKPLWSIVQQMAISSSTQDYRFPKVLPPELKEITVEISVLTPMRKISSVDEIIPGKHGIYMIQGGRGGTFLPQVATETGWTLEEFLGHCARDKAGIGWDGWKDPDTEIFVYEAFVFSEEE